MWNIILTIWLCLLIAAILGGIIGWLLKSLSCGKASAELKTRLDERDAEISRLRTSVSNVKGSATAENNRDDAEISALRAKVESLESEKRTAAATVATAATAGVGLAGGLNNDAENANLKSRIAELESRLDETEGERAYLLERMKKAESGVSIARVVPMDQRDDLEAINGVGPVLEGMLYDMGIYFFKDVASWDDVKIDEVSEQLPRFKNRIRREGWVESAKEEHFKKYGVRI